MRIYEQLSDFFWKTVRPYIGDALRYLRVTQEGQQWIANLYANVFSMEHRGQSLVSCAVMDTGAYGSEIVLNGFGKPEEVVDVQAQIAADFKVRVTFSPADMSKPAAIREMIERALRKSGRLDILVNTRASSM